MEENTKTSEGHKMVETVKNSKVNNGREGREREVEDISREEIRTGLRKMKKGKAQEPDDIPGKLPGDQVDELHYEIVGEDNRSKDKEGGDNR